MDKSKLKTEFTAAEREVIQDYLDEKFQPFYANEFQQKVLTEILDSADVLERDYPDADYDDTIRWYIKTMKLPGFKL